MVDQLPRKPFLRPGEAAYYSGVCIQTIRNWAADGKLDTYTTNGGHLRIVTDSLKKFLAKNH